MVALPSAAPLARLQAECLRQILPQSLPRPKPIPCHAAAAVLYHALAYPPPPQRPSSTRRLLLAVALYFASLVAEALDAPVFSWSGGALSGHTVKHLLGALAEWQVVGVLRAAAAAAARAGGRAKQR